MATRVKKTKKTEDEGFVVSCGNVFEDMGFPPEEAKLLQAKTKLKVEIEREARRQKLSPKELATVLNIKQSQVSDLLTGKVSKMTLDKLFRYFHRLGMNMELKKVASTKKH